MMLTLMREMSVISVSVLSNRTSSLTRPLLVPTEMNLDNATTQVTKSAKNFGSPVEGIKPTLADL